jgi:hypothetical protein
MRSEARDIAIRIFMRSVPISVRRHHYSAELDHTNTKGHGMSAKLVICECGEGISMWERYKMWIGKEKVRMHIEQFLCFSYSTS